MPMCKTGADYGRFAEKVLVAARKGFVLENSVYNPAFLRCKISCPAANELPLVLPSGISPFLIWYIFCRNRKGLSLDRKFF
jgi:hypothetical protein